MESFRKKIKENMLKAFLILCFSPRMRLWAPILAGSSKLSFGKFLLIDSLALSLFTAIYLSLGIIFHNSLSTLTKKMQSLQNIIFFSAVFAIAVVIIYFIIKRKRKASHSK